MVDKNGKLFGKINLIDFLILLVLIAAVVYAGLRLSGTVGSKPVSETQLRVSFFSNEVPNYVLDYIVPGTSVLDTATSANLGSVESFTRADSIGYQQSYDGLEIRPPMANTSSVTVTFTVTAVYGEHGFTIEGTTYAVGHTMTVFAGEAKLYGKISAIEAVG